MPDLVVWTEAKVIKPRRKSGTRVRFVTPDGAWHTYLNEAVPTCGPLIHSVCDCCSHGYSENIILGLSICPECRIEQTMEHVRYLEAQGVPMGGNGKTLLTHKEAKAERIEWTR